MIKLNYLFLILSVLFQSNSLSIEKCSIYLIDGTCSECLSNYYVSEQIFLSNEISFPESECLLKDNTTSYYNQILISSQINNLKNITNYDNIIKAFNNEYLKSRKYLFSKLEFLIGEKILNIDSEFLLYESFNFFKESIIDISIHPYLCDLNIIDNCFQINEYIELKINTIKFMLYITGFMKITNIIFNAKNLNFNKETNYNEISFFCFNKNVDNLPTLMLQNVVFIDFKMQNAVGFSNLISFRLQSSIYFNNVIIENFFFKKGLIFLETESNKIMNKGYKIIFENVILQYFNNKDNYNKHLINIQNWIGKIIFYRIEINNMNNELEDFTIFKLENCRERIDITQLTINNTNYINIFEIKNSSIELQYISIKHCILDNDLFIINNLYVNMQNIIVENCSFTNANVFNIINSDCSINNLTILTNYNCLLTIISSNIYINTVNIIETKFNEVYFYLINSNFYITNILIDKLIGNQNFISQQNGELIINNLDILLLECEIFIKPEQTKQIFLNNSNFINLTGLKFIFARNIKFSNIYLLFSVFKNLLMDSLFNSVINNNNPVILIFFSIFRNLKIMGNSMIRTASSTFKITKCLFENISMIIHQVVMNLIYFDHHSDNSITHSLFINDGFTFNTNELVFPPDYAILFLWLSNSLLVYKSHFLYSKNLNLRSGSIIANYLSSAIEIFFCIIFSNNRNRNPLSHTGIIIRESPYVLFHDNILYSVETPESTHSFIHKNGALGLEFTESYTYLFKINYLSIKNNFFFNCSNEIGGSITIINFHYTIIKNNIFIFSKSKYGGHIAIYSSNETYLYSNIFDNSIGEVGSSIYAQDVYYFSINNCNFTNSSGLFSGAVVIINSLKFNLTKSNFFNLFSNINGGLISLANVTGYISYCFLSNISAKELGGSLYISEGSILSINNVKSIKGRSNFGSFIYLDRIINCSLNNIFIKDHFCENNGIIYVDSTNEFVINTVFILNSEIKLVGTIFITGFNAYETHIIQNIICKNNSATNGACIYFYSPCFLMIKNITLEFLVGNAIFSTHPFHNQLEIYYFYVSNYNFSDFVFKIKNSDVNFMYGVLVNNYINEISGFIQIENSDVVISNIYIKKNYFNYYEVYLFVITNCHIYIFNVFLIDKCSFITSSNSFITLTKCIFISGNNNKFDSGIIYSDSNDYKIFNCIFNKNLGILFWLNNCNLTILNSVFINNTYNFHIIGFSQNLIVFEDIKFLNFENISVFIESNFNVTFLLCYFIQNKIITSFQQNAMVLSDVNFLTIDFCYFYKISGYKGSSLMLIQSIDSIESQHLIQNSFFFKCIGFIGTSIYTNYNNIILKNLIFYRNIAYKIEKINSGTGIGVCGVFINKIENNIKIYNIKFYNNFAYSFGSTFIFNNTIINSDQIFFYNNTELLNIDPNNLIFFPLQLDIYSKSNNNSEIPILSNIVSGIPMNFSLILTTRTKKPIFFDNYSSSSIRPSLFENNTISIIEQGFSKISQGIFFFEKVTFRFPPNSKTSFLAEILIEEEFLLNIFKISSIIFHVKIESRPCLIGEIMKQDNTCYLCPNNTFSLINPMQTLLNNQLCNPCPENTICPGGSFIFPNYGYWRLNNITLKIMKCEIDSCLGNSAENNTIEELNIGPCVKGHRGNLCFLCEVGYGKYTHKGICSHCKDLHVALLIRFCFIICLMSLYLISCGYIFLRLRHKNKYLGIMLKILLNHLHQISIVTFSQLKADLSALFQFFYFTNYINVFNEEIFSSDCLISLYFPDSYERPFVKIYLVTLMPFFLGIILILFFCFVILYKKIKKIELEMMRYLKIFKIAILIGFYIFHPVLLNSGLKIFNCVILDESNLSYIYTIPSELCWNKQHYFNICVITIPCLIFMGFFFPILIFLRLTYGKTRFTSQRSEEGLFEISIRKSELPRKTIINFNKKLRFSSGNGEERFNTLSKLKLSYQGTFFFFAVGYKQKYKYWESLIMIKKLCLIFAVNLNQSFNETSLNLILLLILFVQISFTYKISPFVGKDLNILECYSLLSTIISLLFLGLLNQNIDSNFKFICIICIMSFNVIFFILFFYFSRNYYKGGFKKCAYFWNYIKRLFRIIKIFNPNYNKRKISDISDRSKK